MNLLFILQEIIQYAAIAFVDNTSFYLGGEEFQENINKIIREYEKLYEATGG